MQGFMKLADKVHPHVQTTVELFGITPSMTVVDYGCGPGRYTAEFARLVGSDGRVIAVDLVELALQETQKRLSAKGLSNVEYQLALGYDSGVEAEVADIVFAIDMFHHIKEPKAFLKEVHRITKPEGLLILSGGHMSRAMVKAKIGQSALWDICQENAKFISYQKKDSKA